MENGGLVLILFVGKVAELDIYSPTVQEFEAASQDVDELLGTWNRNLQTFD